MFVHGDDFTFLYCGDNAEELVVKMGERYDLEVRAVVSDDDGDDKEVTILNSTSKHTGDGLECSADPRHEREITCHRIASTCNSCRRRLADRGRTFVLAARLA